MPRSAVWRYFVSNSDGTEAECSICNQKIKSCKNTTNLHSHLSRNHPTVKIEKIQTQKKKPLSECINNSQQSSSEDDEPSEKQPRLEIKKNSKSDSGLNQLLKTTQTQKRLDTLFEEQKSFAGN